MVAHILLFIAFFLPAFAGDRVEIKLKTGKTVSGELLKDGKDELILATDLGTLLIKKNTIESQKVMGKPVPVKKPEPEKKKDDPFELEKIVKDVETRAKKGEIPVKPIEEEPARQPDAAPGGPGASRTAKPGSATAAPAPAGTPKPATNTGSGSKPTGALYGGRLLDRFGWAAQMEMGSKVSIFACLYLIFWGALSILTRLLDVEEASSGKAALAGLIWVAIVLGVLLVPNPTQVIVGILGFCLLVAWLMTTRGILGATWTQSIYLFLLGSLGVLLLYLLVEVGTNILELRI